MNHIRTAVAIGATVGAGLVALATPASAAVPACGNSSLSYSRTSLDGAAGTISFALQYRNVTHSTCSLRGYPGLDAVDAHNAVIAHATRTVSGMAGGASHGVQTINLAPGAYASATVEWSDVDRNGVQCRLSAAINTIAPNTTKVVHWPLSVTDCALQVHPVVGGWTGRG